MSRPAYKGPKIPSTLLNQIDGSAPGKRHARPDISRKDRRKAGRQDKKAARASTRPPRQYRQAANADEDQDESPRDRANTVQRRPTRDAPQPKSILKRPSQKVHDPSETESESEAQSSPKAPIISRAVKRKLEEDDAEIAALEKKLGIRSKKSKALEEDGLDWLANGSDSEEQSSVDNKEASAAEYNEWLKSKRRKMKQQPSEEDHEDDDDDDDDVGSVSETAESIDSDMVGLENPFSDDELDSDDFGDLESDEDTKRSLPTRKKVRENPYVAPVATPAAGKYIPPSLRRISDSEDLSQLRRQIQGQFNRLSEANFLSILAAIEQIYTSNARQHVTTILVDLLIGLVGIESTLSEPFLILHAAFATAIYKVVGTDFGAQLLEKLTEFVDTYTSATGKQVLNLLGFLANLYIMQMVGSPIVFDYIRGLLSEITEDNTELLLRIVRTAGIQLRQDDPTSLKDIILLLTRSVAQAGESNLSVRTKFMIETINDLKNNKMKSGSNLAVEHVVRMKKTIGTLNTRALRASEPLQISLADLRQSDKKGKWWLVGASYNDPAKVTPSQTEARTISVAEDGYESETPGHVSLSKLARTQGMNTDVRRAIFSAIMSASDIQDAHTRIIKLHLKNKQVLEVAKVLLHCAGAESVYNPYYTFIARKLCADSKMQKALISALWDVLRKLNSPDEDDVGTSSLVNTARMYGTLVADDLISITALKTLEFAILPAQAQTFAEVLITTLMLRACRSQHFEQSIEVIFAQVSNAPRMIQGLQVFLRDVVSKADITNSKQEQRTVKTGCDLAIQVLSTAVSIAHSDEDSDDRNSSDEDFL